jgi:hypothetical protein
MFAQTTSAAGAPVWQQMQARTLEVLPAVAAGLFVILLGALLGWAARRLAERLLRGREGGWGPERLGLGAAAGSTGPWSRPYVVGRTIQWTIIFCSTIVALYALDPRLASTLAERVLLYVPHLVGAVLIVIAGVLASKFAGRAVLIAAVNHDIRQARLLASITRGAVVILAAAIALEHAGIGQRTVIVAFAILFGGLTLAASIALGLAMQDPVRRWLSSQDASRSRRDRDEEPIHHV